MKLILMMFIAVTLAAQSATFSLAQIVSAKAGIAVWQVDVSAPGRQSVSGAALYALAAAHKVGHVDGTLAADILGTLSSHSVFHYVLDVLGAGGAATSAGALIKNGGVFNTTTAGRIAAGGAVIGALALLAQPYIAKEAPAPSPDPAIAPKLLGASLQLDQNGSGSALFYSKTLTGDAFTEKLP